MTDTPRNCQEWLSKSDLPAGFHKFAIAGWQACEAAMRAEAADTPVLEPLRECLARMRRAGTYGAGWAAEIENVLPTIEARIAALSEQKDFAYGKAAEESKRVTAFENEIATKDAKLATARAERNALSEECSERHQKIVFLRSELATLRRDTANVLGKLLARLESNVLFSHQCEEYQAAREFLERIGGEPKHSGANRGMEYYANLIPDDEPPPAEAPTPGETEKTNARD